MFERDDKVTAGADRTRERLLEAAGCVFAEHGFAQATVREISSKAGANLAAINYHFGGKEQLYAAVLQYADELSMRRYPDPVPAAKGVKPPKPEDRLRGFVVQFLKRVFDDARPEWHDRVIAREMVEPTPALRELARKNIKPRAAMLQGVVRELLGDKASESQVQLCAASVVGQCLMYHRCKTVVEEVMPCVCMTGAKAVDELAEHVTAFSLAAISGLRRELDAAKPKRPTSASSTRRQPTPTRTKARG